MKPDINKIKRLIKEQGMTQVVFANKLNISFGTLKQYLAGNAKMTDNVVSRIAAQLGVDSSDLYKPSSPSSFEIPQGETYIECPCCKHMISISLKCARTPDPDDPFASSGSCDV